MEKKFAVIYFPSENMYSEIPTSWLTPDKGHCWWPNSINARAYMVKNEPLDKSNWKVHKINFEGYACKYM